MFLIDTRFWAAYSLKQAISKLPGAASARIAWLPNLGPVNLALFFMDQLNKSASNVTAMLEL
jgi:hypothetical protein